MISGSSFYIDYMRCEDFFPALISSNNQNHRNMNHTYYMNRNSGNTQGIHRYNIAPDNSNTLVVRNNTNLHTRNCNNMAEYFDTDTFGGIGMAVDTGMGMENKNSTIRTNTKGMQEQG
ncbi:MAG: hypothetical protein JWO50_484 [Candidatus Kaiserbacteria bacterium]|nr:hypothetical protein [Candidatus Kaiserbacteria bacterium]